MPRRARDTAVVASRARLLPGPAHGMDLDVFLRRYRHALRGQRVFCVVKPRLERRNWCKLGVAQGSPPEAAYRRLKACTILYGKIQQPPAAGGCRGVRIYFCWCVKYNGTINATDTRVHRLELALKRRFKAEGRIVQAAGRGSERVHLPLAKVVAAAVQLIPKARTKPQSLPAKRVRVARAVLRRSSRNSRNSRDSRRPRRRRARHGLDDLQEVVVTTPRRTAGQHASLDKWRSLE